MSNIIKGFVLVTIFGVSALFSQTIVGTISGVNQEEKKMCVMTPSGKSFKIDFAIADLKEKDMKIGNSVKVKMDDEKVVALQECTGADN